MQETGFTGGSPVPSALRSELAQLNREMSDLVVKFNSICGRMESCARSVRDCAARCDRAMFQPFCDIGFAPGRRFRVLGSADESAVYVCTGMDGGGFYFAREGGGGEYYMSIRERPDLYLKIRMAGDAVIPPAQRPPAE